METTAGLLPETSVSVPWWRRYTRWRQTSHREALASERALLALTGDFAGAAAPAAAAAPGPNFRDNSLRVGDVRIGPRKHDYMHATTGGLARADSPPLVALPGYSQGTAYWFRVLRGLSAGFRLYAVDHLGTGLSGRPHFRARSRQEAEDFFVDSLERWREQQGLESFVLMGHSLGGYLGACYAMRHPERVRHLVLISPAGIGRRPEDWKPPASLASPWTLRGMLFRFATTVWEWGATPGVIVRLMGPWGPGLLERYGRNRYVQGHHLGEEEVQRFGAYAYHILAARGSGEFALRHLLAPFAWPHAAIEDRAHLLGSIPITFIYGEQDWMDSRWGERLAKALRATREPAFEADLQVLKTPNAGHYPFMDQPGIFLKQVAQACASYLPAAARERMLSAAAALPRWEEPGRDEAAGMAEELGRSPVEAEAHVATEL